jgi:hypothetical protein
VSPTQVFHFQGCFTSHLIMQTGFPRHRGNIHLLERLYPAVCSDEAYSETAHTQSRGRGKATVDPASLKILSIVNRNFPTATHISHTLRSVFGVSETRELWGWVGYWSEYWNKGSGEVFSATSFHEQLLAPSRIEKHKIKQTAMQRCRYCSLLHVEVSIFEVQFLLWKYFILITQERSAGGNEISCLLLLMV